MMDVDTPSKFSMTKPDYLQGLKRDQHTGAWYPRIPLESNNSEVAFAMHSAGAENFSAAERADAEDKWREENLTLVGLAVQWAAHGGTTTNPMAYVFGEPDQFYGPRQGELRMPRSDTWLLPEAMNGKPNVRVGETIEHIRTSRASALWQYLVPIVELTHNVPNVVQWTVIEFDPSLARETPEMGLPTLVSARAITDRATLKLYKIAGKIGMDFLLSEMGMRHWLETLKSIADGINAAGDLASAMSIVAAEEAYVRTQRQSNSMFKPTINYLYDYMASTFACLQNPNSNVFSMLMASLKETLNLKHAAMGPEDEYVLLLTPPAVLGLLLDNKEATTYNTAGQDGPDRLKQQTISEVTLYGTKIFSIPPFTMPGNMQLQVLATPYEVGEFETWFDETPLDSPYDPMERNRAIYTKKARWLPISFEEALNNCAMWATDGTIRTPSKDLTGDNSPTDLHATFPITKGGKTAITLIGNIPGVKESAYQEAVVNSVLASKKVTAAATATEALTKLEADFTGLTLEGSGELKIKDLYNKIPFNRANLIKLHKLGIRVPLNIIGVRPHQKGYGHSGYLMLPQKVTKCFRKPGSAIVQDDIEHSIHNVSCNYTFGTAVVGSKNIATAPCVWVTQTDYGFNATPITKESYKPEELTDVGGDIIYLAVPPTFKRSDIPRNLLLPGVITPSLGSIFVEPEDIFEHAYPGYEYYDDLFGWTMKKCGEPYRRSTREPYRNIDFPVNVVCREACYKLYNPKTRVFNRVRSGNGYWKQTGTYEDAFRDREGRVFNKNPYPEKFYSV
jgi:hypothetical protein